MMRQMNRLVALLVLLVAATLETGGDALVRAGIRTPAPLTRFGFLLAGAVVLFFYGWTINTPPGDFGRLLGVYVVLVSSWRKFWPSRCLDNGRIAVSGWPAPSSSAAEW